MAAPSTSLTEAERTRLMLDLERNRLLPSGGGALIAALSAAKDPALAQCLMGCWAAPGSRSTLPGRHLSAALRSSQVTAPPS